MFHEDSQCHIAQNFGGENFGKSQELAYWWGIFFIIGIISIHT